MRSAACAITVLCLFGCDNRGDLDRRDGSTAGDGAARTDSGSDVRRDSGSGTRPDGSAPIDPTCGAAAARWIYAVDSDDAFLRFNPETNQFSSIGTLDCPGLASPFSMAIDRDARAWVLHDDGRIYLASTADASCQTTAFAPNQRGFERFGMGYVSDAAGSTEETLFIAGGGELDLAAAVADLGRVDDLMVAPVGSLPGWPELTGTGGGELWGFFPDTGPPSVRRIDKASGTTNMVFPLPELADGTSGNRAWAFAFWGGRFFIFYKSGGDDSTNVWRLDPANGMMVEVVHDSGYRIVGAGVSTCAPVELI